VKKTGYLEAERLGIDFNINNKAFDIDEFIFTNPTSSPVIFNPFDPQQPNLFNYPTSPTSVSGTAPQTYTPISPAPYKSKAVEYNSNLNEIWGGQNLGGGNIYVYDINTQTFNSYPTGLFNITSISYSPVNDKMAIGGIFNSIDIFNATTKGLIINVPLPFLGVNWIEYNSNNNTWVISQNGGVVIVDCVTNAILFAIPLIGMTPQRIAITSSNFAYTVDNGLNTLIKLDLNLNIFLFSVPSPLIAPFSVGINNTLNKLYIGSVSSAGIWTYNTSTDTFISNILPTEISTDFFLHTSSGTMYGVGLNGGSGNLLRIDTNTDILLGTTIFPQNFDRLTLAYSSLNNILYASSDAVGVPALNSFIPLSTITQYIGGSTNYNFFVRNGLYNPYWVRRIYYYSDNSVNFNQTFFQTTKDANGNQCFEPKTPSLSVGTMQFQNGIGMLDFPIEDGKAPLILGINQWFTGLRVEPNSNIKIILIYQEIDKSKLLSSIADDNFDDFVNKFNQPQKVSERQVLENNIMPLNAESVKPFDLGDFNQLLLESVKAE